MSHRVIKTYIGAHQNPYSGDVLRRGNIRFFWLDQLLSRGGGDAGIVMPSGIGQGCGTVPLSILISGPPGSGKSLLAQEICRNWAMNENPWVGDAGTRRANCLYVSAESPSESLISNTADMGWTSPGSDSHSNSFPSYPFCRWAERDDSVPLVACCGLHENHVEKRPLDWLPETIADASPVMKPFDALVVDSLNIVASKHRTELFNRIMDGIQKASIERSRGPKIVLFILDGDPSAREHARWEYVVDLALVFRRRDRENMYLTYSLEIAKARYQQHARGEHVIKVVGKQYQLIGAVNDARIPAKRKEGGLLIFPSVHYHRSAAGSWDSNLYTPRQLAEEIDITGDKKFVRELRAIVPATKGKSPFPRGECIALLGRRGAMKSHVGMHFLVEGLRKGEEVLLVSLRDGPARLLEIMRTISGQEYRSPDHESPPQIEGNANLHLISFQSGCVTPEEFLHRIVAEIDAFQIKKALICAEDQLAVRYPLCNAESLFSEAMIDAMKCRNITTVVVGVDDVEQSADHQGLAALSTLVVKFERAVVSSEARQYYQNLWEQWCASDEAVTSPQSVATAVNLFSGAEPERASKWFRFGRKENVVTLVRAVRVPAGMPGGQTGILRLDSVSGLHLTPLPANFPPARMLP